MEGWRDKEQHGEIESNMERQRARWRDREQDGEIKSKIERQSARWRDKMFILGQVRLSCSNFPTGLGYGLVGLEPPQKLELRKNNPTPYY